MRWYALFCITVDKAVYKSLDIFVELAITKDELRSLRIVMTRFMRF